MPHRKIKIGKHSYSISTVIVSVVMVVTAFSFCYPIIFMTLLSLKDTTELYSNPFGLPEKWLFSNYLGLGEFFNVREYFLNSLIYTVGTVLLTVLVSSMYAYGASRMNFKLKNASMNYISIGLFVPSAVVVIPLFLLTKQLGIRNTYLGLILPYTAFFLPSSTMMFYAFFKNLPFSLEEAAIIDGCGIIRSFFTIILPSIKSAVAMQIILNFLNAWNEFFLAYLLVTDSHMRSLPIGLLNFFISTGINKWGFIGAAMVISSVPTLIVYLIFHNQVEKAMTAGAILK